MAPETSAQAVAVQDPPGEKKILVIDDERALRQTVIAVLEYAGYQVLGAADGIDGVRRVADYQPDLIISDIVMPGMDGYGLLKALRENPDTATIPVIFVTALAEHATMRQIMALGADDYLVKPFKAADLLTAVHTRLHRQAMLAEKHDTTMKILRKNIIYALPHEMRTPLHLILGFAQILEMNHVNASPREILQATSAIVSAGQRLERLIENYLVYAQMEVIASDPDETRALRNHVTQDADRVIADKARQQAAEHERTADLVVDVHPAVLRMAQDSIVKIVTELVDNACKFSQPGTPVRVTTCVRGDSLVLSVCDAGRGMSPEQIRRIGAYMQFERAFYEQQGLGLGLAIVRRLAELHAGRMEIKSVPDQGTQVCVYLPQ